MPLFELWFSLGICPVVGLLDHMVILLLVFEGTSILFSIVAVLSYIPINSARGVDKEDVAHIYNGILLRHKKERNYAICSNMDGPRDFHTK